MTDDHKDYKREIRRQFRPKIRQIVKDVGFAVKNVKVMVDESCDPQVGFAVRVVGQDTPENKAKVEHALRNFAYNITFVKR